MTDAQLAELVDVQLAILVDVSLAAKVPVSRAETSTRGTPPGCWAHARRYFWDAKASDPARALLALGFIRQLYAVEREVKGADARCTTTRHRSRMCA